MNKFLYALFFSCMLFAADKIEPIKVYLIISSRTGDYTIEKIFLKKENAQKYCEIFKESHNYTIEEKTLNE